MSRHEKSTINGSTDIAIALNYDGNSAPRITAKGQHLVADSIIEAAEQAGVPLYPDPELAMILSQVPIGEEIPDNLYKAIAEVIAFAYILAGKFPEGYKRPEENDETAEPAR
jgi:flagellar biosynthesis protein